MKIYLNPNEDEVKEIRKRLKENDNYCPCQIEKTEDTRCMCKLFREQNSGYCHCGLYYKQENQI